MLKRLLLVVAATALAAVLAGRSRAATAGNYIVVLKDGSDTAPSPPTTKASQAQTSGARYNHALDGYAATLSPAALKAVKADPRVEFVSADRPVSVDAQTCRPASTGSTASSRARASGNGSGSVNVNVAVSTQASTRATPTSTSWAARTARRASASTTSTATARTSRARSRPRTTPTASSASLRARACGP